MAKPYIVERNGKIYVRIPYKDSTGKWKQKWQKAQSKSHAQRLIGPYLEQRDTLGGESLVNKDTLNAYLDRRFATRAKLKVSQSTFEDYQRPLENHVRDILGKKKLAHISVTVLQGLVNSMQEKSYQKDQASSMRKAPWHSIKQSVYHDNAGCNTGNNISREDLRQGTGGKPLCNECCSLNESICPPAI
jgi:hypothetical protein